MSHRIAQDLTPDGMLAPLSGVRHMRLVSLEEAIGSSGIDGIPCIAELPGMDDIDDAVFAALGKAEELIASGGPDPHGLTAQHIAALNLYTQDALYGALNKALRAADREQIKPYFSFLRCVSSRPHLEPPPSPLLTHSPRVPHSLHRLLLDAFSLLPAYHPHGAEATIFRGINKDLSSLYIDGAKVSFIYFRSIV